MKAWFTRLLQQVRPVKKAYPLLLFLDIDGVLHPHQRGTFEFVDNFQRLLDIFPEASVVISSSWRLSHDLVELQRCFDEPYRHRVIGVTPSSADGDRETEVLMYLQQNPAEVYLAVDDDRRLFKTQPAWLHVVPASEGLNTQQITLLIAKLNKRLNTFNANKANS